MLKATFTIKNMSEAYLASLTKCEPRQAFQVLRDSQRDLGHAISMKVGTGQIRNAVEFNDAFKANKPMTFTLEPRKGYKLATFELGA